jgi:CBS domain-containing protein
MTGGAFGSLIAQLFSLTAAERKTLLVSGAAAGMSATFGSPVAAILLAVELMLFEWKPRSFIPVALASATAAAARMYLIADGPLFPMPEHAAFVGVSVLACCVLSGLAAGLFSGLLTALVYAFEDLFKRLPIHWMWWPALGGLAIGIGGLIAPHALGVGYDVIAGIIHEGFTTKAVLILVAVKAAIWSISLGSGTSGGVLAPLLMMGGALGAVESHFFPDVGLGFWALVSMGAILGGTMRSPFTGIVFIVELTHDMNMFLPLVIAVTVAHGFTVLILKRSILTEKVARRGLHVSREYAIDELEVLFVRDVMATDLPVLRASDTAATAVLSLPIAEDDRGQHLFAVLDDDAHLIGAITRTALLEAAADSRTLGELAKPPDTVQTHETLRGAVQRMAKTDVTALLVVNPDDDRHLVGVIALHHLLDARAKHLEDEERRERVLPWEYILPQWIRPKFGREKAQ